MTHNGPTLKPGTGNGKAEQEVCVRETMYARGQERRYTALKERDYVFGWGRKENAPSTS